MTSKRTNRDALDSLTAALIEDILSASDEDVMAEARQDHASPAALAAETRALFENAAAQTAKSRLVAARSALANERRHLAQVTTLDAAEARRRVEQILAQYSNLTLAARKGQRSSDSDIQGLLEDFKELGLAPDAGET